MSRPRNIRWSVEALDPLEWLARMGDHIPDPGQHRTIFHAHYANHVRGGRQRDEVELHEAAAEPPRRRRSPSWARLIARVYQVDPLLCVHCGQRMQMIALLADQLSIRRILEHLGFSSQPQYDGGVIAVTECRDGYTARAG